MDHHKRRGRSSCPGCGEKCSSKNGIVLSPGDGGYCVNCAHVVWKETQLDDAYEVSEAEAWAAYEADQEARDAQEEEARGRLRGCSHRGWEVGAVSV
tara:strand:+ start:133 stop:423 length:291 start_codon:yes stop_codon:yes gene_type:complete